MSNIEIIVYILGIVCGYFLANAVGYATYRLLRRRLTLWQTHMAVVAILLAIGITIALLPGTPLDFNSPTN